MKQHRLKQISLASLIVAMLSMTAFATNPASKETPVTYTGIGTQQYWIEVPSKLEPSQSGKVKLWGTWDSTKRLDITTSDTIKMINSIDNGEKELSIEFEDINQVGNNTNLIEVEKEINVEQIENALFGTWSGQIDYNIVMKKLESISVEQERYQLSGTDNIEIPITTLYGNSVEIENSDSTIATVTIQDNKVIVTPIKEGVTTIKLKSPATSEYEASELEFKIDVSHNYVNGICTRCGEKDISSLPAGLYDTNWNLKTSWATLIANKTVYDNDGVITTNPVYYTDGTLPTNNSSSALNGILIIPEGVNSLGNNALLSCNNLTGVVIPNSLKSIGNNAFFSIGGKLSTIIVKPNNNYFKTVDGILYNIDMTTIIKYPISKTASTFSIPKSVTKIGSSCFQSNTNLITVTIPYGVETIENQAFDYCLNLQYMTVPNSVTSLGNYCFVNCIKLHTITLSDNLTSIGMASFSGTALKKLYIPASVKYVYHTTGLDWGNEGIVANMYSTPVIYCGASSKPSGWSYCWNYKVPSGQGSSTWTTYWGYTREQFNALP